MTLRRTLAATLLGLASLTPLAAAAQVPDFGPSQNNFLDARLGWLLEVPPGDTGPRTLELTFAGVTDPASRGGPYAVSIDGTVVGEIPSVPELCIARDIKIQIPAALYEAAAEDGDIEIEVQPIRVDTELDFCGGEFGRDFSDPFTEFNSSAREAGLAVQGSFTRATASSDASAEALQETIAATRGTLILQNGPSTSSRIARLRSSTAPAARALSFEGIPLLADAPFAMDVTRNGLDFSGDGSMGGMIFWAEGTVAGIDDDASDDQTFAILNAGIDARINDRMLLGLGLQLDRLDLTDTGTGDEFEGTGWMIGPLLTYRIEDNLFFDGRVYVGQVDTDVARAAGGEDSYDSDRTLVQLSLTGDVTRGAFVIAPRGELGWYRESSDAYTSVSLGAVGETEVTVKEAVAAARISQSLNQWGGIVSPYIDLGAAYADISGGTPVSGSYAEAIEGWSGQVSLGATFSNSNGVIWSADIGAGGIGTETDTISASIRLDIPF